MTNLQTIKQLGFKNGDNIIIQKTFSSEFTKVFEATLLQDEHCEPDEFYYKEIKPNNENQSFGSIYDEGITIMSAKTKNQEEQLGSGVIRWDNTCVGTKNLYKQERAKPEWEDALNEFKAYLDSLHGIHESLPRLVEKITRLEYLAKHSSTAFTKQDFIDVLTEN